MMANIVTRFIQNVSDLIQRIKTASVWKYRSKLILISQQRKRTGSGDELQFYRQILVQMSNNIIYNVAILVAVVEPTPHYLMLYHNPFGEGRDITAVRNPQAIDEGFPNKIANLHGFAIELQYLEIPPAVMVQRNQTYGVQKMMMDLFVKQLNGSCYCRVYERRRSQKGDVGPNLYAILINAIPVASFESDIEYISSNQVNRIHFMVANRRMNVWLKIFAKQFSLRNSCLYLLICACFSIAYLVVFKRHPRELVCSIHKFIAVSLLQPTPLSIENQQRRILYAAMFCFFFCNTTAFVCMMTSDMISYFPDQTIRTAGQILDRNLSIYAYTYMKRLIDMMPELRNQPIMRLVKVSEQHPWLDDDQDHEASIVGDDFYQVFSKSALHLNEFGKKRFYLLSPEIISLTYFYTFHRNAPYVGTFKEFMYRVNEAGLHQYWTTVSMTYDKYSKWSYFRGQPFQPTAVPQTNDQMFPAYSVLFVGLILCSLVFLVELVYFRWSILKNKLRKTWQYIRRH